MSLMSHGTHLTVLTLLLDGSVSERNVIFRLSRWSLFSLLLVSSTSSPRPFFFYLWKEPNPSRKGQPLPPAYAKR